MIKAMMAMLISTTILSGSLPGNVFAASSGSVEKLNSGVAIDERTAIAGENEEMADDTEAIYETIYSDNHLGDEDEAYAKWQQELLAEKASVACGHLVLGLLCGEVTLCELQPTESIQSTSTSQLIDLTLVTGNHELGSGANVTILDEIIVEEQRYVKIATYINAEPVVGYVARQQVITSDEKFETWEKENFDESAEINLLTDTTDDIWLFPESYRDALTNLKALHPNWHFIPLTTGLNWSSALDNELTNDRSWIHKSVDDRMKAGQADQSGNWYYPTREALAYYMDPRNYLNENDIFQFELLTYNSQYHTETAVSSLLNNTFMNGYAYAPGTEKTFAQIFMQVGASLNVSPLHLASRVYQEQGQGTSPLISGTYSGYEGYYNYFNVRASGKSDREVIVNGLAYAKSQNWSNAELSINGGASLLASSYILKGQDTLYLQKFNVNPNGYYRVYNHQYMQNIVAALSEGRKVKQMYEGVNSLGNDFVFRIPVYESMPATASPNPTVTPVTPIPWNGWYQENGGFYWYENGVRQGTEGRGKEIYDPGTGAWYWLDAVDGGKMAVNKDVYQESDGGKWVRYDEYGKMIKGDDYRYGGWYYFDQTTGAMLKGWRIDAYGNKYFYDITTGQRVFGYYMADGILRYFDVTTGILANKCWVTVDGQEYWYEEGIRQGYDANNSAYRGKEIYDPAAQAWFWLDNVQAGAKTKNKDVYQESEAGPYGAELKADGKRYGKWVHYDANGYMVKGWYTDAKNNKYYFDPTYGTMIHGTIVIDGKTYQFDSQTGILKNP